MAILTPYMSSTQRFYTTTGPMHYYTTRKWRMLQCFKYSCCFASLIILHSFIQFISTFNAIPQPRAPSPTSSLTSALYTIPYANFLQPSLKLLELFLRTWHPSVSSPTISVSRHWAYHRRPQKYAWSPDMHLHQSVLDQSINLFHSGLRLKILPSM